jgi:hypothetical protein
MSGALTDATGQEELGRVGMHAATYCSDGPGRCLCRFFAKFTVRPAAILALGSKS